MIQSKMWKLYPIGVPLLTVHTGADDSVQEVVYYPVGVPLLIVHTGADDSVKDVQIVSCRCSIIDCSHWSR